MEEKESQRKKFILHYESIFSEIYIENHDSLPEETFISIFNGKGEQKMVEKFNSLKRDRFNVRFLIPGCDYTAKIGTQSGIEIKKFRIP